MGTSRITARPVTPPVGAGEGEGRFKPRSAERCDEPVTRTDADDWWGFSRL